MFEPRDKSKDQTMFSHQFIKVWWMGVLFVCVTYFILRIVDIIQVNASADTAMVALGSLSLLYPLFSEFSFMGISVKREIANLKGDVKDEIKDMKALIYTSNTLSQNMNQQINIGKLPTLQEVNEYRTKVESASVYGGPIDDTQDDEPPESELDNIHPDTVYLLSVKYLLENEIKIVLNELPNLDYVAKTMKQNVADISNHYFSPSHTEQEEQNYYNIIIDILDICERASQGEVIDRVYVEFVQDIIQKVLRFIRHLNPMHPIKRYK